MMLAIESGALSEMRAHAEETYPEECCGVVLATPNGQRVRRMANVQNRLHAADPVANPRDARTAYNFDSRELFDVNREGDQPGWKILVFYHSHPDHGEAAYFSPTDKQQALTQWEPQEPTYPGTVYIVFAVCDGAVTDAKAFTWDEAATDFVETPIASA
jgi:proteasome lid subunit RPN8/RPN11